jgi:hypothetical protein
MLATVKAWILVALVGCASAQHRRCADVADHSARLLRAAIAPYATNAPPNEAGLQALHDVIAKHCEADAWSEQMTQCELAARDADGVRACDRFVTDAQRAAIDPDLSNALAKLYPKH